MKIKTSIREIDNRTTWGNFLTPAGGHPHQKYRPMFKAWPGAVEVRTECRDLCRAAPLTLIRPAIAATRSRRFDWALRVFVLFMGAAVISSVTDYRVFSWCCLVIAIAAAVVVTCNWEGEPERPLDDALLSADRILRRTVFDQTRFKIMGRTPQPRRRKESHG